MSRSGHPTVAAFDFDGTLTEGDSVVPFVRAVAGMAALTAGLLRRPLQVAPAALRRDRDRIKAIASAVVFTGRPVAAVEAAAARHGAALVAERLRADTLARLRWHQDQGHLTVLVSASYELYLRHVATELGLDGFVGARLEVDGARLTGRLDGPNCRGAEKVRRLDRWLAERGFDRTQCTLYAYGDSIGDRELLAVADHPCWVSEPLDSVAPAV